LETEGGVRETVIMKELLHQVPHIDMSPREGAVKLVITMLFVPIPILVFTLGGFWLDYYQLDTSPILTAIGAVLGTLIAFLGICRIIIYGHKRRG